MTRSTTPDGSITTPTYNEANLLESSSVDIKGGGTATKVVFGLDYNARGQRLAVSHNDTDPDPAVDAPSHRIEYEYDEKTFRVIRIETTRAGGGSGNTLQKLRYTYDAVGNITEKRDEADWDPDLTSALNGGNAKYTYDALYRLTRATGREHAGQQPAPKPDGPGEPPYGSVPHGNDLSGMRDYVEETTYDEVGNIVRMRHLTGPSNSQTWERNYDRATASNRLLATSIPGDIAGQYNAPYSYDVHGNMVSMPHLPTMTWDFADRLQSLSRLTVSGGSPDQMAYYTYDPSGQRVRKVYEHNGIVEERIYLGSVEIYRKRNGSATDPLNGTVQVERETHHVMDDTRRVAMAETLTVDLPGNEPTNVGDTRWRYQLDNHLGSSAMEIDGSASANVISYEEFHPYGTTAFHLSSSSSEVSAKRYRYTGTEKDEESGLYYHGARYYAPWLGRWTAADPAGLVDGLNLYRYSRDNPVRFNDPGGTQTCDRSIMSCPETQSERVSADLEERAGQSNAILRRIGAEQEESAEAQEMLKEGTATIPQPAPGEFERSVDEALQKIDPTKDRAEKLVAQAEANRNAEYEKELEAERAVQAELPQGGEAAIPFVGSGKSAAVHFGHGNYVRGSLYGVLAISDAFLLKSLVVGGVRYGLTRAAAGSADDLARVAAGSSDDATRSAVVGSTSDAATSGAASEGDSFLYRVLREDEIPSQGLHAKNPNAAATPTEAVRAGTRRHSVYSNHYFERRSDPKCTIGDSAF